MLGRSKEKMSLRVISSGNQAKTEAQFDNFYFDSVPYEGNFPLEITPRDRSFADVSTPRSVAAVGTTRTVTPIVS